MDWLTVTPPQGGDGDYDGLPDRNRYSVNDEIIVLCVVCARRLRSDGVTVSFYDDAPETDKTCMRCARGSEE